MDALAGHATALSGLGGSFASTGERVNTTWQQLAPVYDAPEVGQLLAATGPVQTTSASVGEDISAVGAALATYAATVRVIKAQLESLRSQAQAFVDENGGNDDWEEDDGKVDRNNQLVEAVNAQVAAFYEAQRTCANTINALYGGPQYRADDGDGQVSPGEYGYTAEQLGAAAGQDGALPWGSTQEHDRGLLGDVGSFLGGIGEGAVNFVTDLGALIGRDPTTGEWSWSTAGTAWAGLGKFALAVGMTMNNPGMLIRGDSPAIPGIFAEGEASALVVGAGKAIIAYDEWGKGDNSRAAGMATFNVASAIIGTKGAGAALRGGGAAVQASRIGAVSRAGTAMIRGGEFLGRLPTTESLALRAQQALPGLRLPDFGNLGRVDVPHHVDTPHLDTPRADAPSVDVPRVDAPNPGSVGDNLGNRTPSVGIPSTPDVEVPVQRGDHSPAPQAEAPDPVAPARQDTAGAAEHPGGHGSTTGSHVAEGDPARRADDTGTPVPEREPALLGNGASGDSPHMDAPNAAAPNDGAPVTGEEGGPDRLIRQDDDFSQATGPNGDSKSGLDDHGNLVPANPDGDTTVRQHVLGNYNAAAKGDSPFTSFFPEGHDAKLYGNQHIALDYRSLGSDIASGRVQDVEIVSPDQVQRSVQDAIDQRAGRHVDVTLRNEATPLDVKRFAEELGLSNTKIKHIGREIQALLNTRRDNEWLIRGIIPAEYLDGPHTTGS